ncbi:hypothetical protein OTK49_02200 [Vibrio coralliirubri]|nr:hypothetical protein [Vibrio coralliirubri]MCY9861327.1 hypothetical protein [Vibrio coralliirubri]
MKDNQIITQCDSDLLESINSHPTNQSDDKDDNFEGYISVELNQS